MAMFGKHLRETTTGYLHHCPGCGFHHHINTKEPLPNGAQWTFNGDPDKPTFNPSISLRIPNLPEDCDAVEHCHYFIQDGQIRYCSDSTHDLAGQTVQLPEWESEKP